MRRKDREITDKKRIAEFIAKEQIYRITGERLWKI